MSKHFYCVCCDVELESADVVARVEATGTFDGYCRDCLPGHCPACDGEQSVDDVPLGQGKRLPN